MLRAVWGGGQLQEYRGARGTAWGASAGRDPRPVSETGALFQNEKWGGGCRQRDFRRRWGGGEGGAWLALKSPSQPPGQGGRLGAALFLLGDSLDLSPSALPPPSPSPEQGSANSSWEGRAARMPLELLYFLSIIARGDRRGTHHPAAQRRAPGRARGVVLLQVQLGGQPARGGSR